LKRKIKIIVSLFFWVIISQTLVAQINRIEITGAYIYNFAKHTTWPNEKEFEKFNICLMSENPELIKEFKHMAEKQKVKGKAISLMVTGKPGEHIPGAQLVFVAADKSEYYLEVFDMIEHKPIMLVGNNIENKRVVILNLYDTKDKKLLFEINKVNIYNQELKISDEILLMGGTEIDVVELYLQSQETLREMDKEMTEHQKLLDILDKKTNTQKAFIENQNQTIEKHTKERESLLTEINTLYADLNKQKEVLRKEHQALISLHDSLNESKLLLAGQDIEIETRKEILNQQKTDIDEMNKTLAKKDQILGLQDKTISRQRLMVYLFGAIIFLIVIPVLVLYNANKYRKKKNALLQKQKEEINENYEEIKNFNEQLNEKNTELSVAMEKLKVAQQQIVQSEKMASLGVLTAGIAHEINNPINFIYTGINSLKKDFNDLQFIIDEVNKLKPGAKNVNEKLENIKKLEKEYYFEDACLAIPQTIKDISKGIDRTVEIINGLKFFSRMVNESVKLFNIHTTIDNSLLMLKNKYKNRISIQRNYDKTLPKINCNPGKLIQAFMNIIDNAIDAIEDVGEIEISTKLDDKNLIVSIKDSGKGMDMETREKIFDPFFTTKDVGKGTGLGMAITYGIIKEHKAEIDVKTEIGKGTEFIITFPVNNHFKSIN